MAMCTTYGANKRNGKVDASEKEFKDKMVIEIRLSRVEIFIQLYYRQRRPNSVVHPKYISNINTVW